MGNFLISDVMFDVKITYWPSKNQNIKFLTSPSCSSGEICIYTNFQLNLIIFWHSNTIWMTFWAILWYLTSYLTSQSRLTPSKILKYHNSDITIGFPSKKTHLYAVWDQHGHFNDISVVLGYFWIIWVILGVHDFTMGSKF